MEITRLMSEIRRNLRETTKSNPHIPKLPDKLADNSPEELETIITLALRQRVEQRGIPFEDISGTEMEKKIKRSVEWLTGYPYRPGLLIQGSNGNGKTTLMEAIYWLYHATDTSVVSVKCEKLVEYFVMQLSGVSSAYTEYRTSPRLCIDELGIEPERCMVYGVEYTPIQSLLMYRYEKQLPTIITTNLSDAMIEQRYGVRIMDRIAEMCTILRFSAPSYRK